MKARFLLPARLEFLEGVGFYESRSTGLGELFIREVERALELLSANPRVGSLHLEGTRRLPLRRFPFDIVYLVESDEIVVIALAHHRRKPGYWRDRRLS